MPISELRLIRRVQELAPKEDIRLVPPDTRGLYVLFQRLPRRGRERTDKFNVVYIGIATAGKGIAARLRSHRRSRVRQAWTHFSVFEVWDNISEQEIRELEGLFRHIYRWDRYANRFNVQRGDRRIVRLRKATTREGWMKGARSAVPKRTGQSRSG